MDYKTIKGRRITAIASDPTPASLGQVWFNTAGNVLKYTAVVGAWAAGGTSNTQRSDLGGNNSGGTQSAYLIFGGYYNPVGNTNYVESYNGTAWTAEPTLPASLTGARGCGVSTAVLSVDGNNISNKTTCSSWNGSSWSGETATGQPRRGGSTSGSETAALVTFGSAPSVPQNTEEYDGNTWTAGGPNGAGPESNGESCGTGTQTAAINMGANSVTLTQTYDGSTWTEEADLNLGRGGGGSFGTSTAAMYAGGVGPPVPGRTLNVEEYDGSTWTETTNMSVLTQSPAGGGTTSAGLRGPGSFAAPSYYSQATEEWNVAPATKTVTSS